MKKLNIKIENYEDMDLKVKRLTGFKEPNMSQQCAWDA